MPKKCFNTYKPLILIVGFISGVSLSYQYPFETNLATAIILGVSSIGAIQSNLNKKKKSTVMVLDMWLI